MKGKKSAVKTHTLLRKKRIDIKRILHQRSGEPTSTNKLRTYDNYRELTHSAAAVISVCNEDKTIGRVLHELEKLPISQIVVVLNGCTDQSFEIARQSSKAIILIYPDRIGHDVGRAAGTKLTNTDIVLYIDGDFVISALELMPFLIAVDQGVDVALNDISAWVPSFDKQDNVTRCKSFLNSVLGRDDLHANSLTAVPHALSRRAIQTVGIRSLIVPPKAQTIAIMKGLDVAAVHQVDVVNHNRVRPRNVGIDNDVTQLIIGDHLEALSVIMEMRDKRLMESRSELAKRRNLG